MTVVEKTDGTKIPYEVSGNKITFDDDLTINLSKREQDWAVHIDVCYDSNGGLVIGAAAGRAYAAEIDIPQREYTEVQTQEDSATVTTMMDDRNNGLTREPVSFNMENVTLTLWAVAKEGKYV